MKKNEWKHLHFLYWQYLTPDDGSWLPNLWTLCVAAEVCSRTARARMRISIYLYMHHRSSATNPIAPPVVAVVMLMFPFAEKWEYRVYIIFLGIISCTVPVQYHFGCEIGTFSWGGQDWNSLGLFPGEYSQQLRCDRMEEHLYRTWSMYLKKNIYVQHLYRLIWRCTIYHRILPPRWEAQFNLIEQNSAFVKLDQTSNPLPIKLNQWWFNFILCVQSLISHIRRYYDPILPPSSERK